MASNANIEITERDEAGNITATYVTSESKGDVIRIDTVLPTSSKSPWQSLLDMFLPAGYPHSVTDDYLEYQIYDSLQAFSSSIASMLASRAVLSSVGVGDSTASPTAALLLSVLQQSAGRLATIFFAHRFGTALEPECKMYRLLADILNDFAFILDCLSPAFPKTIRVVILSFSSVLRALCGVAAGSAKASLSAHFARWGNLGELNAKDSSQETVISLFGMWAGSVVVSYITTQVATWTTLIALLAIHLETNRRAVRAVSMRTLNRQRATLVFHRLKKAYVPTPVEVSLQERIFEQDGVLRNENDEIIGHAVIGGSVHSLLQTVAPQNPTTKSLHIHDDILRRLLLTFNSHEFLIWFSSHPSTPSFQIVLKQDAGPKDVLIAWWTALFVLEAGPGRSSVDVEATLTALGKAAVEAQQLMKKYDVELGTFGWDLDVGSMETISSKKIEVGDGKGDAKNVAGMKWATKLG